MRIQNVVTSPIIRHERHRMFDMSFIRIFILNSALRTADLELCSGWLTGMTFLYLHEDIAHAILVPENINIISV